MNKLNKLDLRKNLQGRHWIQIKYDNKIFLKPYSTDKPTQNMIYDRKYDLIIVLRLPKAQPNLGPVF